MLTLTSATRIHLAPGATDMRKSFNGLYALAAGALGKDPLEGHLFIFANRSRDRIKILFWDGTGLWVCGKRLEKGTFAWPAASAASVELTHAELQLLVGGIDLGKGRPRRWAGR
jgi:transposase